MQLTKLKTAILFLCFIAAIITIDNYLQSTNKRVTFNLKDRQSKTLNGLTITYTVEANDIVQLDFYKEVNKQNKIVDITLHHVVDEYYYRGKQYRIIISKLVNNNVPMANVELIQV